MRRSEQKPQRIGVDETSFRKRHEYVTVVSDQGSGKVLHVADDRTKESLTGYYDTLSDEQKAAIESVSMDMWPAYMSPTLRQIPGAEEKIAFDKFHVAKYLGEAVGRVRRLEPRATPLAGERI